MHDAFLFSPSQRLVRRRSALIGLGAIAWPALATPPASTVVPRRLDFPRDFGSHPPARTEWWYITGALSAANAAAEAAPLWGFQITFFRSRTDVDAAQPSAFAARQLVFAHAAVSDLAQRRLRHDQRIARAGFGIAEAAEADTDVSLRDWRLARSGSAGTSHYQATAASDAGGFAFDLQLAATQPVLLQGDAGYSRKGPQPGQASLYYSEPQLGVQGRLTLDGRAQPVQGRAWLDHEWSDTLLDPQAVGWDWIGMNLADGGALTAFRLRRRDGSAVYAGGSLRVPGGTVRTFGPGEVRFTPGRRWTSPSSHTEYPVEWTLETPAGRHTIAALLDAQELDSRNSTGSIYWEGLSELRDPAGRVVGQGYLEMTGYAAPLAIGKG